LPLDLLNARGSCFRQVHRRLSWLAGFPTQFRPAFNSVAGDWGINGRYYKEKVALLRDEGLIISVKGRVDSKPFEGFVLPPR
jgi:hypothetical protein